MGEYKDNYFNTQEFEEQFFYNGKDLGANYLQSATTFKVWAPTAQTVMVKLYAEGNGDNLLEEIAMKKGNKGVWTCKVKKDLAGVYYTYAVTVDGVTNEAVDLYAKAVGANGNRGMVIDLSATNPKGWNKDKRPDNIVNPTDAIIYELHVRDFSMNENSGMINKGKYLAFTELGTKNSAGLKTGMDHIKELGVTHIQLLPVYDYASINEERLEDNDFNWGYDPKNYNAPEGSYSSDPTNGAIRINEFKQMIQQIHKSGLRVVMDVVYNHTFATEDSNFNKIVPKYYHRTENDAFTDASACGNEVASDRAMVRKYIVESVVHWAKEYHIDGFRFDLMGILDIDTMNEVKKALNAIDKTILIYGEGWTAQYSPLEEEKRAMKDNMSFLPELAAFSDDMRDAVKGHVFKLKEPGFVSGCENKEEAIKYGVVGSVFHEQVDYSAGEYSKKPWAVSPTQTINYVSVHDNLTLWDKLAVSAPQYSREDRVKMNKLAATIVMTSQGIALFQAGEEMLRSKPINPEKLEFDENSFVSSDAINCIKWDEKTDNKNVFDYYKGLIAFRKEHPALRMVKATSVQKCIKFYDNLPKGVVAYEINAKRISNETAEKIIVVYNASDDIIELPLDKGVWSVCINANKASKSAIRKLKGKKAFVAPLSALVLVKDKADNSDKKKKIVAVGTVLASAAAAVVIAHNRKK